MSINIADLLSSLPEDPIDAIERLVEILVEKRHSESDFDFMTAAKLLRRMGKEYLNLALSPEEGRPWSEDFDVFVTIVSASINERRMDAAVDDFIAVRKNARTYGYVGLHADDKQQIRKLIEKIRQTIDASDVDERKKNAVRKRLAQLELEIDRAGTPVDNALGLIFDITFAIRGGHKNLDGVISDAKEITRIIVDRRESEEKTALPPADKAEMFSLPSPDAKP